MAEAAAFRSPRGNISPVDHGDAVTVKERDRVSGGRHVVWADEPAVEVDGDGADLSEPVDIFCSGFCRRRVSVSDRS